jgi:hypothetical protein
MYMYDLLILHYILVDNTDHAHRHVVGEVDDKSHSRCNADSTATIPVSCILTLGPFSLGSLVQCPDEIWHNSAAIPAVPFKEPLPAYSPRAHNV